MASARIKQAIDSGRLKSMVAMNKFDIIYFRMEDQHGDQKFCIATENLNSCHGVAIISRKAAVLGHIAPSSPTFPPGETYAKHFVHGMVQFVIQDVIRPFFEYQGINGVVVVGFSHTLEGSPEIVLPHQMEVIAETLRGSLGHRPTIVQYGPVGWSNASNRPDKGKVFIEGFESGQPPVMWVEENQVLLR
ncbi:MAG: hypothetical protein Q9219_003949 [cf. Caloplaca sp. 3 TL-2023]